MFAGGLAVNLFSSIAWYIDKDFKFILIFIGIFLLQCLSLYFPLARLLNFS
jgi:hypothetical protein